MRHERRCWEALLAVALLAAACGETKTGSNGTGAVPTEQDEAAISGTLVAAEPLSVGVADLLVADGRIRRDDAGDAGVDTLRLGMQLEGVGKVTGPIGAPVVLRAAGSQGVARGSVDAVDVAAHRFTIATLTFVVDENTIYDGLAGLAALAPGATVDVSGLPTGDLRSVLATRVASAPADGRLSIAARIESFTPQGLSLAGIVVPAASSTNFNPQPAIGSLIRVSGTYDAGSKTLTHEQVTVVPGFAPVPGARVELEGIALDVAGNASFRLRTPARDYEVMAGAVTSGALASGSRVRVSASAAAATSLTTATVTVLAGPIAYRLAGTVTDFASLSSLRVRGEPVDLSTAVVRGGNAADISNGRRIVVVGNAGPGALRVTEATIQP